MAAGLALLSGVARADDISKGMRGPPGKDWQADERLTYSTNENRTNQVNNTFILKYWNGDTAGKWVFVGLPYKIVNSPDSSRRGVGDVTIGAGPRGRVGNLHLISYGSLTLPSGSSDGIIKLGNGRYDKKVGLLATYLAYDKRFEVDGALEYNFTGRNKGTNTPDETYWGVLTGMKVSDSLRAVTGITKSSKKNGDYLVNSRTVVRYTVSPKLHFELVCDVGLKNRTQPKGFSIGLYNRYNF